MSFYKNRTGVNLQWVADGLLDPARLVRGMPPIKKELKLKNA